MQRILMVLLVASCATASAEVFRRTGPDGEVYFSDRPAPDAQRVDLNPAQAVQLRTPPRTAESDASGQNEAANQKPAAVSYAELTIVKPSYDQGVRANGGSVTVYLSLQPALQPGHAIMLKVDGEDGERIHSGETLNFNLSNMSRGRHTVAAKVVNQNGEELIRTGPVGFYVLRAALGGRGR
jgi:hypothetical protein